MTDDNNKSSNSSEENHVEKQVIDQTNFGRFQFYKRIRIEEYEIQIDAQQNLTDYPGLVVIGRFPFTQLHDLDWSFIAYDTIKLVILDLIINDFVELITFTDKEFFLGKLLQREYRNCRFTIKNKYTGEDNLAVCIIECIEYIEQDTNQKADLHTVIKLLLNEYLGENVKHDEPTEVFVRNLLYEYNEYHHWITLTVYPTISNYPKLTIIPQWQEELKHAYTILYDTMVTLENEIEIIFLYSHELYRILDLEFGRRTPNRYW